MTTSELQAPYPALQLGSATSRPRKRLHFRQLTSRSRSSCAPSTSLSARRRSADLRSYLALAPGAHKCIHPVGGFRQRKLPVLQRDAAGRQGESRALEAVRLVHGRRPRRGARQGIREGRVRRGGQGRHAAHGARNRGRARTGHQHAHVDDRHDQEAGARQAARRGEQDRLSRISGATTDALRDRPRRRAGQLRARQRRSSSTGRWARSASRSTRANGT